MASKTPKQPVKSVPEIKKKQSPKISEEKTVKITAKKAEPSVTAASKPKEPKSVPPKSVSVLMESSENEPAKTAAAPSTETSSPMLSQGSGKWEEIRNLLLKMKSDTLQEISRSIKNGSEANQGEEPTGDIYDQASSERDRELGLILNDRERDKLHSIDDALLRMSEGDYGICEECDDEIPLGRLKVLPFTRHCVRCKSDLEKVQAQTKRFEEDRAYREIPMGDDDDG